jgi:hypothetical protein
VGTANLTLFDAQSTGLDVTDVPSGVTNVTTLSVAPGILQSLIVVPQTSTPVAGVPFGTDLSAFDEYGNVDTNYTGGQCILFSGLAASPDATGPTYPVPDGCSSGSSVTFAAGIASGTNAPNISLFDAVGGVLNAQDVSTGVSGFAGVTVSPGGPKTFALGAVSTQVAGTAFPVSLTTLDQYGNVDTNYSGNQCITFSGGSDAPLGTGPSYGPPGSCSPATQITFAGGLATGVDVASITLYDVQTLSLVATDTSSGATGSVNLSVGPAALDSFSLAPSDSSPVAGNPFSIGITALDQYGNTDTNYSGSQCIAFTGASIAPDGTGPSYLETSNCSSGGTEVTFEGGIASEGNAPSLTLYDSQLVDLIATDVPSQHFGSTSINVSPGTLHSFAVIPDATTETAGASFNVRLTALDQYQNVDTNFTGAQCVTFTGPDNAPNGATPTYPALGQGGCATGSSAVTFADGYVDGPNILSVTLFDAETVDLTATLTTGTQTGSQAITVNAASAIAGIGITGITQNTTPQLSCTGGVGSITCSSSGEDTSSNSVLTASIQLEDQYGNATVNATANSLFIDIGLSGQGNVATPGTAALSVSSGQSISSSSFTLTRDAGIGQTVVMTATLENTSPAQTVTLTLGS